jgi:hypothetical protein
MAFLGAMFLLFALRVLSLAQGMHVHIVGVSTSVHDARLLVDCHLGRGTLWRGGAHSTTCYCARIWREWKQDFALICNFWAIRRRSAISEKQASVIYTVAYCWRCNKPSFVAYPNETSHRALLETCGSSNVIEAARISRWIHSSSVRPYASGQADSELRRWTQSSGPCSSISSSHFNALNIISSLLHVPEAIAMTMFLSELLWDLAGLHTPLSMRPDVI